MKLGKSGHFIEIRAHLAVGTLVHEQFLAERMRMEIALDAHTRPDTASLATLVTKITDADRYPALLRAKQILARVSEETT